MLGSNSLRGWCHDPRAQFSLTGAAMGWSQAEPAGLCNPPLSPFGFVSHGSVNAFHGALPTQSEVLSMHRQWGHGQDDLWRPRGSVFK